MGYSQVVGWIVGEEEKQNERKVREGDLLPALPLELTKIGFTAEGRKQRSFSSRTLGSERSIL